MSRQNDREQQTPTGNLWEAIISTPAYVSALAVIFGRKTVPRSTSWQVDTPPIAGPVVFFVGQAPVISLEKKTFVAKQSQRGFSHAKPNHISVGGTFF